MITYNKSTVVGFRSAMVSRSCVRPTSKKWFLENSPWNIIQLIPSRNPCRPYIHLAFTYFVGPSSVVRSELGPTLPFSNNESAWYAMVIGPKSKGCNKVQILNTNPQCEPSNSSQSPNGNDCSTTKDLPKQRLSEGWNGSRVHIYSRGRCWLDVTTPHPTYGPKTLNSKPKP